MHDDSDPDGPRSVPSERSSAVSQAIGTAVRFWWISMLRGSLALVLGIGALVSEASQQMLVNFIGLYWLLGGLLTAKWAVGIRWKAGSRLGLAAGALGIGTGMILLARRGLADIVSTDALINPVATTTIITGGLRLVGAFEIEERTGRRWTLGASCSARSRS